MRGTNGGIAPAAAAASFRHPVERPYSDRGVRQFRIWPKTGLIVSVSSWEIAALFQEIPIRRADRLADRDRRCIRAHNLARQIIPDYSCRGADIYILILAGIAVLMFGNTRTKEAQSFPS